MKMMNGFSKSVRMRRTAVLSATAGVLALLLFGAAGTPTARAQAGSSKAQQMLQTRATMQSKNLGLTPDQTKQLVQINTTALQQVKALMAKPPADRMAAAEALKGIADKRKASLGQMLTKDQMKKLAETNQKDMASFMTLSLDDDVNLTSDQMKKAEKTYQTFVKDAYKGLNMDNKVQAAQALTMAQKSRDADLKKTLTPAQWTQYEAM